MKLIRLALATAVAASLACSTGCATIFAGQTPGLVVNVDGPDDPDVTTMATSNQETSRYHGRHVTASVHKGSPYVVVASADGYNTAVAYANVELDPLFWIDLFVEGVGVGLIWTPTLAGNSSALGFEGVGFLCLLPVIVDFLSQNGARLKDRQLNLYLEKRQVPAVTPAVAPSAPASSTAAPAPAKP